MQEKPRSRAFALREGVTQQMLCIAVFSQKGFLEMPFILIIEGNHFEKGLADAPSPLSLRDISPPCGESPSNSLPKTFGCFSVFGIGHMSYTKYAIILKVFGKGFGEEPFLRKVCPDKE